MRKVILIVIVLLFVVPACFYGNYGKTNPPEISSFSAYPDTIIRGQSVTISWEINNISSARIEPIMVDVDAVGEMILEPLDNCSFTLIAESDYGIDSKTIQINVLPVPAQDYDNDIPFPPVIYSFRVKPDGIWAGAPVQLTWEVYDATELFLSWGTNKISLKPIDTGSIVLHPVIPTSYLLIAENPGGSTFSNARIEVISSIGGGGLGTAGGGGGG